MKRNKKKHALISRCGAVLFAVLLAFPSLSHADTDLADLSVGIKTLPLLNNRITGSAEIAIIFDPTNDESKQEAENIKSIISAGELGSLGDLKLIPVLLPVGDIGKIATSKVAVLSSGLGKYYTAISNAVVDRNILTMSTDLECVKADKCVLGIQSKPHVEIYYSKIAADNTKVSFGQVFTMLAKQI